MSRVAWAIAVIATALVAVDVWVSTQAVALTSETAIAVHGFPLVHGACIGSALMGALIVARYERHPIGWLLSAIGLFTSISLLSEAYAFWVLERGGPGSQALGSVSGWLSQVFGGQLVIALLAWLYLLAPDGHFLTRRWRYAALVPGLGALLCLAALLSVNPTTFDLISTEDRVGPVRLALLGLGFTLISLGIVVALVSMVLRLGRSTGEKRQQLRLIALSAGLAAVALVSLFVAEVVGNGPSWASQLPLFASFFLMPILFAVAVLRYRLYDLDAIINRTVVVAVATTFAAVGYTTLVVLAGQLVEGQTGGFWLSLLATALVALAFQPLRRSVVRLANRAAYGERAQPYEALADFSRRLAAAPDPDDLLPAVAEAAARAVSARGARATLDVPGGSPVSASWGWWSEAEPAHVVPVHSEGREIGRIAVALPQGRPVRTSDLPLLEALADQTAVAFRNTSLAGALAGRVAALDRTTRELAGSRRRLIEADDRARMALESAIARDVMPFLEALPAEIRGVRAAVPAVDAARLELLVDGINTALESLRQLTRGVFPAQLASFGLEPALRSLLAPSGSAAQLTTDGTTGRRYPPRVEAAVYFCCAEAALASATPLAVVMADVGGQLVLRIRARLAGMDVQTVTDRAEAVGGSLSIGDELLVLTIPVTAEPESVLVGGAAGTAPGH